MIGQAAVDERDGRLFIQSLDTTTGAYPLTIQGTWLESADVSVADEELGELVVMALSKSRNGVPVVQVQSHVKEARKRLLKRAGVRSESQYEKGMRHVRVEWDEAGGDIVITPFKNSGARSPITEISEAKIQVNAGAERSVIGESIRMALAISTAGPA